ncbi:MAG TPA: hypothetical protein VHF27_04790 [Acidimicrobiales bacterium]|nr:hypothetical protein [Acidimicrobiales bacterium]
MTVVAPADARVSLPLLAHVAALAVVLLALVPVVGTSASFSTDEGAAIVQAKSLSRGGGWVVEHPLPEVDQPDGRHYPLELAEWGERGFVPYGKHPLYPLLLAAADRVGGVTAMVLLSVAGTVAAAALAGALARRLDASLAGPAVWAVGVASPLLFDGFLVMGHTLAAALAAGAVLAAVVALERRDPRPALAVGPLVAGAVLLRSEAVFLALGLAVVAAAVSAGRRRVAGLIALGSLAAGAGAHLFETWWLRRLTDRGTAAVRSAPAAAGTEAESFLSGRWRGFVRTVLSPTYGGDPLVAVLLLVMVVAVVAMVLRRQRDMAALAAATAVLALVMGPETVVPGLLVAFPVATAGLVLVRRSALRTTAAQVSLGVFAVIAACVVATQYAVGGATEWGGRFFAVGLPVVVPVLLLALKQASLDRWVVVSLVVCSLAMATLGVSSLRHQHRRLGQLVNTAASVEAPVVVATYGSVPRWAWRTFDDKRWLITQPSDLPGLLGRLRDAGVARIGLVTPNQARDRALLGTAEVVSSAEPELARGWHILVVALG